MPINGQEAQGKGVPLLGRLVGGVSDI